LGAVGARRRSRSPGRRPAVNGVGRRWLPVFLQVVVNGVRCRADVRVTTLGAATCSMSRAWVQSVQPLPGLRDGRTGART
jgi:hypothetical protein